MEADWEAARLLTLQAAWMADNRKPNSLQASMAKAKAGRMGTDVALRCVALAGATGYGESELLEKWARDAKILDLFEGTQQIQLLIIARQLYRQVLRRAQIARFSPLDLRVRMLALYPVATENLMPAASSRSINGRPSATAVVTCPAVSGSASWSRHRAACDSIFAVSS